MDPMSAISLAGTVVQFVDFSVKLVAKSSEIYNSGQGASLRNIELEGVAKNLSSLTTRLKQRTEKACAFAVSEDEVALRSLCNRCCEIGQELLKTLDSAKVHGTNAKWKSVRQALKEIIGGDRIKEMYESLTRCREQIVVLLLVIINAKHDKLSGHVIAIDESVKQAEAKLLDENRQTRAQILDAIQSSRYSASNPQDVVLVSRMLSSMMNNITLERTKGNVLNSLYYPRMMERREWISEAHRQTFGWALQAKVPTDTSAPWDDLQLWLREGNGVYWLTGKAGSGKSTLMKFIQQADQTQQYLEQWAHPLPCIRASFYFWNPGTSMQKSQLGLLQCLLYEILSQRPDLIGKILPPRWTSIGRDGSSDFAWSISELLDALKYLTEVDLRIKFCFFIDGLDEFDGDHVTLIRILLRFTKSPNLKILASSRPWLVLMMPSSCALS